MVFRLLASAAVVIIVGAVPTNARAATLAPTPYMGWNTYYGVGGVFDEATIKSVATSLIDTGLAQAGYRIVWLDFGWASGARDSNGNLTVSSTQWPDGMAGLTAWLHQQGLEAGIYTDAGRSGCNGEGVGSYGHYQRDANTFAAWGFDAVKVDFCGAGQEGFAPQPLYAEFSQALSNNSSHRPMILNACNFWTPGKINGTDPTIANSSFGNYVWAPQLAHSWRTDTDIGFSKNIQFQWVLRNLDQDATHPEAAGPGHWNDPDYLGPGLGNPTPTLTDSQAESQFSMWAMLAAPLVIGSDPRALTSQQIGILENPSVIAVDQDPLGVQGTLISQAGSGQVWAKPLANGDVVVALFNRGTASLPISTTAGAVGLPQASGYTIQDLWANTPWANPPAAATTTGSISAPVPPQSVTLYRVTPETQTDNTGALRVAMEGADSGTVSANPGPISCPNTCSARYPAGSPVTLSATPQGGAAFAGWNGGGCSGTGPCTPTPTTGSTTSVSASFAFPLRTLTVNRSGSGSVTDASGVISCPAICSSRYWGGTVVTLNATPDPGYIFSGWAGGGCSGAGACTLPLADDTSVSANFVPAHTLTVSVIGGGAGAINGPGISCPGSCTASYPAGTPVKLTATPASGSQFGAWLSGGCPPAGTTCTVTLSADTTVTVAFDRPRSGTAYVADARRNDVVPIELATNTVERPIRGFDAPRQIAISPDGGTAYVVNAGSGTVTPIDLATNTAEPAIRGIHRPGPIAIAPDGKTAYVLEDGRTLVSVDLVSDQAESAITFRQGSGIAEYPASLAIAPNGRTAYLGSFNRRAGHVHGTVAVVELGSDHVRAVIRGFGDPGAIVVAPDGRTAYVADRSRGSVVPVNLVTDRRIPAPALTATSAFPGADAVALTPDGTTAYVADALPGVAAIETATGTRQSGLMSIPSPRGLAITPDGEAAYVASAAGEIVPIDLATGTERPALAGVGFPSAVAITDPPPPNDSVRLAALLRRTGSAVSDGVRCIATTACTVTETLTMLTGTGGGPVQVVLGRQTVTIRAGRTLRMTIGLGSSGQRLLAHLGRLPVVLSVAIRRGYHLDTVATRRLTITG